MIEDILGDLVYDRKLESETVLEYITRYVKTNRFVDQQHGKYTKRKTTKFLSSRISLDIVVAILFIAAVLSFLIAIFTSKQIPLLSSCLVIFSLLLFFTALIKSIYYFYNEFRAIDRNTKNNSFIQKVRNFNLSYYEKLIDGLSSEYSLAELKTAEMTLSLLMKEKKAVDRMFVKFTRIIAIFLVVIIYAASYQIDFRGNPLEYLKQTTDTMVDVLSVRTRELIGLIILITIVLNVLLESISRMVSFYEIYLLVLRKAIEQGREKERKMTEILKSSKILLNSKLKNMRQSST
jgi:hypothetical protein